jgi:hypothetical protein
MPTADRTFTELRLPNTLHLPPNHTAEVVGHLLRKLYAAALENEPCYPDTLGPLIEQLGAQESSRSGRDRG